MAELKTNMCEFRKQMNISQMELGRLVGVRRETIGNLENGKYNPSLKLAMDIAEVFGKRVEEVFYFEGEDDIKERLTAWRKSRENGKLPSKKMTRNRGKKPELLKTPGHFSSEDGETLIRE